MASNPLERLSLLNSEVGDIARETLDRPASPLESPEQTTERHLAEDRSAIQSAAQQSKEFADRGIPTYRDTDGAVQPVRDSEGAALTSFDRSNKIAYDSAGNPQRIEYGESGAPELRDPFQGVPVTTDKKTGDQYQVTPGLPWKWVGKDQDVSQRVAARETEKEVSRLAQITGQKLSLDQREMVAAEKTLKTGKKELGQLGINLDGDPELSAAFNAGDRQKVLDRIDGFFNEQFAAKDANPGFFSGGIPSPEVAARRQEIENQKSSARDKAVKLIDLNARLGTLRPDVQAQRGQMNGLNQQRIAAQIAQLPPELRAQFEQQTQAETPALKALGAVQQDQTTGQPVVALTPEAAQAAAQDPQARSTILGEIGKGLVRGWAGAMSSIGGLLRMVGAEETGSAVSDYWDDTGKGFAAAPDIKTFDPANPRWWAARLPEVAAGIVPQLAVAAATGGASVPVQVAAFATMGGGLMAGDAYNDAFNDRVSKGESPETARDGALGEATFVGIIGSALDAIPGMEFLASNPASRAIVSRVLRNKVAQRFVAGALTEGTTEVLQEITTDLAKYGYRADAEAFNDAANRYGAIGLLSAVLGGGVDVAIGHHENAPDSNTPGASGTGTPLLPGPSGTNPNGSAPTEKVVQGRVVEPTEDRAATLASAMGQKKATPETTELAEQIHAAFEAGASDEDVAEHLKLSGALKKGTDPLKVAQQYREQSGVQPQRSPSADSTTSTEPVNSESHLNNEQTAAPVDAGGSVTQPPASPGGKGNSGVSFDVGDTITSGDNVFEVTGGDSDTVQLRHKGTGGTLPAMDRSALAQRVAAQEYTHTKGTVDAKAHEAASSPTNSIPEPTPAQKEAGNYKKGHVKVGGLDISVENPAGSERKGTDKGGKPWSITMQDHYGYVKGTTAVDGDHVDIFLRQGISEDYNGPVHVVDQVNPDGTLDEHKALAGYATPEEAKAAYLSNYAKGWKGFGSIRTFPTVEAFKAWLPNAATDKRKPAAKPQTPAKEQPLKGPILPVDAEHYAKKAAKLVAREVGRMGIEVHKTPVALNGSGLLFNGGKILMNPEKVAKTMENIRAIQQIEGIDSTPQEWVNHAVREEVLHMAQEQVAKAQGFKSITAFYDSIPESAFPQGWEEAVNKSRNDASRMESWEKKAEFVRMVAQKRWNGTITEALYKVLTDVLNFLKGIAESPGNDWIKAHVSDIENTLRGVKVEPQAKVQKPQVLDQQIAPEPSAPKAQEPAPEPPKSEAVPQARPQSPAPKPEPTRTESQPKKQPAPKRTKSQMLDDRLAQELGDLPLSADAPNALDIASIQERLELNRAALANLSALLRQFDDKLSAESRARQREVEDRKARIRALSDRLRAIRSGESLNADAPVLQHMSIPVDKIPVFLNLAKDLIEDGTNTPEMLYDRLKRVAGEPRARAYSRAMWSLLVAVNVDLNDVPDWTPIFAGRQQPEAQEPEQEPEAAITPVPQNQQEQETEAAKLFKGNSPAKDLQLASEHNTGTTRTDFKPVAVDGMSDDELLKRFMAMSTALVDMVQDQRSPEKDAAFRYNFGRLYSEVQKRGIMGDYALPEVDTYISQADTGTSTGDAPESATTQDASPAAPALSFAQEVNRAARATDERTQRLGPRKAYIADVWRVWQQQTDNQMPLEEFKRTLLKEARQMNLSLSRLDFYEPGSESHRKGEESKISDGDETFNFVTIPDAPATPTNEQTSRTPEPTQPTQPAPQAPGPADTQLLAQPGEQAGTQGSSTGAGVSPSRTAANEIAKRIKNKQAISWPQLFEITDKAFGGTQAEGKYTVKDAYDALELGVNLHISQNRAHYNPRNSIMVEGIVDDLKDLLTLLPTQTKRTAEQDAMQQFSTPPHFSYVANWVANYQPGDVMLEPSDGVGGLSVFAQNAGAKVIANELSPRRRALAAELKPDYLFGENAEQLHAILEPKIKAGQVPRPTKVVMNPPFSNAAKSGEKGNTLIGAQHVEEALKLLPEGGRLVTIVGEGMAMDAHAFRKFWPRILRQYNVRANVLVDGKNYTKYGTSFSNRLIVIDKNGPTADPTAIVGGEVGDISELIPLLEGVRNDRPVVTQSPTQQGSSSASGTGGNPTVRGTAQPAADAVSSATSTTDGAGGTGGQPGGNGNPGTEPQPAGSNGDVGQGSRAVQPDGVRQPAGSGTDGAQRAHNAPDSGVTLGARTEARSIQTENEDGVFANYHPSKVSVSGAKAHPANLVESAAMASVPPPDPVYTPNLPKEVVEGGVLSEAQIENVIYAGQAHAQMLETGERRGYFIGDGTGVGKGRQISGIILDNLRQGRTKAVWISKSAGLIEDAKRDAGALGIDPKTIRPLMKVKTGNRIEGDGIIFSTYDTLKGGHEGITSTPEEFHGKLAKKKPESRIEQLAQWLGKDFDGVIVFDEAHMAGNAISIKGKRGEKKASKNGVAVVDLQRALPNARVVYVSATGATEVENLSYADRLGIWGPNTPFSQKRDFFSKISAGGISAMEIVARDLKAMGLYLARSISYKGVKFDRLTQELTPQQRETYGKIAEGWQNVLATLDESMADSGANNSPKARSSALSAFWGAQQRFFNQLLTAMQMPTLLADMRKQLDAGNSLVLQLVNTNEASQNREISRRQSETAPDEEMTLEDMDLSPRDILLQYIQNSFPTLKYEKVTNPADPEKTIWRVAKDSEGNPIQDPDAIAARDRLMDEISLIDIPSNPLEQILNTFGVENVAEVTGRTQRIVQQKQEDGTRKTKIETRKEAHRQVEAKEFQDGKRRILIFSQAGGTGFSFHADRTAKNQQQRVHYLVQAGWRADAALQGFGRTHRTNQASAPEYKLVETNIPGHKRFISTIARRLAQLGALTTGERKSAGQGMFSESDNMEGQYAEDAMKRLIYDLHTGNVEGSNLDEFARAFGFIKRSLNDITGEYDERNVLVDPQTGALVEDKIPSIQTFLNRILVSPLDRQAFFFNLFTDRMEARIERAKNDGTYDPGTQLYKAGRIEKVADDVLYTHPGTAAATRLVEVKAINPVEFNQFEDIQRLGTGPVLKYVRNKRSNRVYALREGMKKTDTYTGAIISTFRRVGTRDFDSVPQADIKDENYDTLTEDQAQEAWEKEIADAPKENAKKAHFLVGAMLPVWDRIQIPSPKIYRFTTSEGESMLGVLVPEKEVFSVRRRMGAKNTMTPEAAFRMVLDNGSRLTLANGWTIRSAYVSRENRIEVEGLNYNQATDFTSRMGGTMERIQFRSRYFIPTDEAAGVETMRKVLAQSPIVSMNGETLNADAPTSLAERLEEAWNADDLEAMKPIARAAGLSPSIVDTDGAGAYYAIKFALEQAPKAQAPAGKAAPKSYAEAAQRVYNSREIPQPVTPSATERRKIVLAYKALTQQVFSPSVEIADVMEKAGFKLADMDRAKGMLMHLYRQGEIVSLATGDWSLSSERERAWGVRTGTGPQDIGLLMRWHPDGDDSGKPLSADAPDIAAPNLITDTDTNEYPTTQGGTRQESTEAQPGTNGEGTFRASTNDPGGSDSLKGGSARSTGKTSSSQAAKAARKLKSELPKATIRERQADEEPGIAWLDTATLDSGGTLSADAPSIAEVAKAHNVRYDGQIEVPGVERHQFTIENPESPAHKATFIVRGEPTEQAIRDRVQEKEAQFTDGLRVIAGKKPGTITKVTGNEATVTLDEGGIVRSKLTQLQGDTLSAAPVLLGQIDSVISRLDPRKGARWFWEGTADVLERAGYKRLAKAVWEQQQANAKYFADAWKPLDRALRGLDKKQQQHAKQQWAIYFRHQETAAGLRRRDPQKAAGRQAMADATYKAAPQYVKNLIDAWKQVAKETGLELLKLDTQVKDGTTWRQIGHLGENYFPRKINRKVSEILRDPSQHPQEWNQLVQDLIANGNIQTPDEAEKFRRESIYRDETDSDYYTNIERARKAKLPESWLEYSFSEIAPWYVTNFARRASQIKAYGQTTDTDKDLWDKTLDNVPKTPEFVHTQEYIKAARDAAYYTRHNSSLAQILKNLQTIATGTFLSSPFSTIRNFISGTTQTAVMFGPMEAIRHSFNALVNAKARLSAHDLGVIRHDLFALRMEDKDDTTINHTLRKFANAGLQAVGFNFVEDIVRTAGVLSAVNFARLGAREIARDAGSAKSRQFIAVFRRMEADPLKIVREHAQGFQGEQEETERFIRRVVIETQGGYSFAQTPLHMSEPLIGFLTQFQKWGTQMSRFLAKHVINPLVHGTEFDAYFIAGNGGGGNWNGQKGRFSMDPNSGGIPVKVKVRSIRPFLYVLLFAILGGEALYALKELLTGRKRADASLEEIASNSAQPLEEAGQIAGRLLSDVIMAGTLGMLSDYGGNFRELATRGRFKNPLDPPGLQFAKNIYALTVSGLQQGGLTLRDALDALYKQAPGLAFTERLTRRVTGDKVQDARNVVAMARDAGNRAAEQLGMPKRGSFGGDLPTKTANTAFYNNLEDALLTGDAPEARLLIAQHMKGKSPAEREKMLKGIKSSVSSSAPVRIGGIASAANRSEFFIWARKHLPADDLNRIKQVDHNYWRTATALGLVDGEPVPREMPTFKGFTRK